MDNDSNTDEDFYYEEAPATIKLSHLNTKSSVLAPDNPDITSQFLVLQQLNAHQQMIARAKSTVDTSSPKSLQSYLSMSNKLKKKSWERLDRDTKMLNGEALYSRPASSSRTRIPFSAEEDDNLSSTMSLNKGVQTGFPTTNYSCKTADKIAWYLEALNHGGLESQTYTNAYNHSDNNPRAAEQTLSKGRACKRVVRGDIMDWHKNCFVQANKPFYPKILADPTAKSKVRDMRCYNPPYRRRKPSSSQSSDTFESCDQQEDSEDSRSEIGKSSFSSSTEEDARVNATHREDMSDYQVASTSVQAPNRGQYFESLDRVNALRRKNKNEFLQENDEYEENKYLNFLSKVTGDILRSGIYSDQAIQQTFEFHMQFYQAGDDKDKFQSLLNQVLNSLKIYNENAEETPSRRSHLLTNLSRPNTPPEKENPDTLQSPLSDLFPADIEFNSRFMNGLNLNAHRTEALESEKSSPQENMADPAEIVS